MKESVRAITSLLVRCYSNRVSSFLRSVDTKSHGSDAKQEHMWRHTSMKADLVRSVVHFSSTARQNAAGSVAPGAVLFRPSIRGLNLASEYKVAKKVVSLGSVACTSGVKPCRIERGSEQQVNNR